MNKAYKKLTYEELDKEYYNKFHKKTLHRAIFCSGHRDYFNQGDKGLFMQIGRDFRGWIKNTRELRRLLEQIGHD